MIAYFHEKICQKSELNNSFKETQGQRARE